jgi:hypothetical protein
MLEKKDSLMSQPKIKFSLEIPKADYEKLAQEVHQITWSFLQGHAQRGALFWVDPQLDLVQVAWAISQDQLTYVESWLTQQLLQKADDEPLEHALAYRFIIVQPYVLASVLPLEVPPPPTPLVH